MKTKMLLAIGLTTAVALAAAETVVVHSSEIALKESSDINAKKIDTIYKNTTLNVLEKKGNFMKVAAADKQGWIRTSDLEPLKIGKSGASVFGSALAGDGSASEMQDTGAGKGLFKNADEYARSVGVDPKRVDAWRKHNKDIADSGEVVGFAAAVKKGGK